MAAASATASTTSMFTSCCTGSAPGTSTRRKRSGAPARVLAMTKACGIADLANQPGLLVSSVQLLSAVGLDQVHCSHAAHVVGVSHQLAAWGVQSDFTAVASHPAAAGFTPLGSFSSLSARRS